jgi:hypothetical protein
MGTNESFKEACFPTPVVEFVGRVAFSIPFVRQPTLLFRATTLSEISSTQKK